MHDVDAPNSFKYTMKGDPEGNGSGFSRTSSKVVLLLDKVMEDLATATYVRLHLGPGEFLTRGNASQIPNKPPLTS